MSKGQDKLTRILQLCAPEPNTGCWLWFGTIGSAGYGIVKTNKKQERAHRALYELVNGPVEHGLDLDHLCRVRCCVNPDHLEPVTRRVNLLRGETIPARKAAQTHCIHGHPFDEQNTYHEKNGTRKCKTCRIRVAMRFNAEKRARGA